MFYFIDLESCVIQPDAYLQMEIVNHKIIITWSQALKHCNTMRPLDLMWLAVLLLPSKINPCW